MEFGIVVCDLGGCEESCCVAYPVIVVNPRPQAEIISPFRNRCLEFLVGYRGVVCFRARLAITSTFIIITTCVILWGFFLLESLSASSPYASSAIRGERRGRIE